MTGFKLNRPVTFFTYIVHTICRSTPFVTHLRYPDELVARTQSQPSIPVGPNDKIKEMYYLNRDAKREVQSPSVLFKYTQSIPREDIHKLSPSSK